MEERDNQVYVIPQNYNEAGGTLGGILTWRNAIETVIVVGIVFLLEFKFLPMNPKIRFSIMFFTLLPLTVINAVGIFGDPVSVFLLNAIDFMKRRRALTYRPIKKAKKQKRKGEQ